MPVTSVLSTPLSSRPDGPRRGLLRTAVAGTAVAMAVSLTSGLSATAAPAASPVTGPATSPVTAPAAAGVEAARTNQPVVVRLKVADRAVERIATLRGTWPGTLLDQRGVAVDGNDLVVVKRNGRKVKGEKRRVRDGDTVKVVDVRKRTRVAKVRVAPRTVKKAVTSLKPGRTKVVAKGKPAVHRVKIKRTLHNDRVVDKKVVSRKVVRKAKPRRVLVGRKASSVPGADGLNWAGLARCESGGNPRAVNPSGYYGLYQFNVGTWRSVGGSGMPHHASAAEQTHRAKLLYKSRGRQPWPHCGRYL